MAVQRSPKPLMRVRFLSPLPFEKTRQDPSGLVVFIYKVNRYLKIVKFCVAFFLNYVIIKT